MTAPPTNVSQAAGVPQYLPYIIAIPAAVFLTCAVVITVLIGKCFHMHYWKSVRDEAENYRMQRYEAHIGKLKKKQKTNNNTSNVKLQSVIKSASPTHPHPHRTDIPLEARRMRTYQVPLTDEGPPQFQCSSESFSSPVDQTTGRPLTPDSGKVLDTFSDDLVTDSGVPPGSEIASFSFQTNLDGNGSHTSGPGLTQGKNSRSDPTQYARIQEFTV